MHPSAAAAATGRRVLVLGMGGGCDCICAYALARQLSTASEVRVGNTIGPRTMEGLSEVSPHVWEARGERLVLEAGTKAYHTTMIEQSLPRDLGPPLVLILPSRAGTAAERTAENRGAVVAELDALGFDLVVGVDTGGDVLSGGIDFEGDDPELARDRQCLHVLTADGLRAETMVAVFGPCSDGETGHELMGRTLERCRAAGGWDGRLEPLAPLLPLMRELAAPLLPMRTPNIIAAAADGLLEEGPEGAGFAVVPRQNRPSAPLEWLTGAAWVVPGLVPSPGPVAVA